jgi:hypothetical protein
MNLIFYCGIINIKQFCLVGKPSPLGKRVEFMTTFEALSLMITFSLLVLTLLDAARRQKK